MGINGRPPLRLLLLTDCLDVYGAERWNLQIIEGLQHRAHCVAFAQPRADNEVTSAMRALGVHQHWLSPVTADDPWRPYRDDDGGSVDHDEARSVLDVVRPDVVVFSDGEPGASLAAKEVTREVGVPYVVVSHLGFDAGAKERNFPRRIVERIAEAHRAAEAVVGVSTSNVATIADAFGLEPSRLYAIPNGRPERFFASVDPAARASLRAQLSMSDEQVLFCTLARPHPNKRYSVQIDAIRLLRAETDSSRIRFVWAGGGAGVDRLRLLVRTSGLDDIVTVLGYVPDPTALLGAADVFVLSSAREGMPMSIVEAMARGLPIIATDVGGVAEAVGDAALLMPDPTIDRDRTVREIRDAMASLSRDASLRKALGAAAKRIAAERYREELMIDRYENLLGAVVRRAVAAGDRTAADAP